MPQLILVNGKPGSGKTTVSDALREKLQPCAWIDTDHLMRVRPWKPGEETFSIALQNGISVAKNFLQHGYSTIVLTGCVHSATHVGQILKEFGADQYTLTYVLLHAQEENRKERKRLQAEQRGQKAFRFDVLDAQDLAASDVKPMRYVSIETTQVSIDDIVRTIFEKLHS